MKNIIMLLLLVMVIGMRLAAVTSQPSDSSKETATKLTTLPGTKTQPVRRIVFASPMENVTGQEQYDPAAAGMGDLVAVLLAQQKHITVVERQPRVMWDENGQLWWIGAEGIVFPGPSTLPPSGEDEGGEMEGWLVRGPLPRDEDGWLDERVRVALAELWAVGADVSPLLYYVPARGLVLTDERGWRVIVGRGPGMDRRLQVLEWLAADLEARGLAPRFVDVRFADAPYYSLTNDW